MNTCEEMMDCIQFSYSEIDSSLKYISFTLDDVISELEVYDTEHKKIIECFIKFK
ncbi:hypothetical protein [Succinivibrio dextrinosolvens]|uniref:hypothetical protein n=1 Tax=Succinivibrio dextrinosolvens TaxID=83771 RepID=UPI00241D3D39|nr:hypothetical protein [Succinivibrio dextrinosolvens]